MQLPPLFLATAIFILGICIGSFLNVVIWRLAYMGEPVTFRGKTAPLGLNWPPSHCPHCQCPIRWYQNIPVLAWLVLRGRCAGCRQKIPVRYPLVELATGLLFAALYLAFFHTPWGNHKFTGLFSGGITLALDLLLVTVLFVASGIDADWYEIPNSLTLILMVAALATSFFGLQPGLPALDPSSVYARLTVGGTVGLLLSLLLLWRGLLPRSFSQPVFQQDEPSRRTLAPMPGPKKAWPSILAAALIVTAMATGWLLTTSRMAVLLMLIGAILIFLLGVLPRSSEAPDETQQVLQESALPSARTEILKELLFILPPLVLAGLAALIPFSLPHVAWLQRLLGVLLGILFGGGLIWLTRIAGTLALGRVAMGLGDVHLLAAIGAVVGPKLILPIFFIAPVLGLLWAIVLKFMGKPNVLPYGPWLSMAAILALLIGWPIEHWYLLQLFPAPPTYTAIPIHWPGTP